MLESAIDNVDYMEWFRCECYVRQVEKFNLKSHQLGELVVPGLFLLELFFTLSNKKPLSYLRLRAGWHDRILVSGHTPAQLDDSGQNLGARQNVRVLQETVHPANAVRSEAASQSDGCKCELRNCLGNSKFEFTSIELGKFSPLTTLHFSPFGDQIFSNKDKNLFFYDCHYAMNGAIISYDEGLINGDRELAAALWRTFFQKKCSDYRKLEVLVHYVRVQVRFCSK